MPICKKCNKDLDESKFTSYKKRGKEGKSYTYKFSTCTQCRYEHFRSKPENVEKQRKASREHYHRNFDRLTSERMEKRYGITKEQYDILRAKQNYCCSICLKNEKDVPKGFAKTHETALHVDHDHDTGKIRGLLCTSCNTMLGQAHDDCEVLKRAIDYLEIEDAL